MDWFHNLVKHTTKHMILPLRPHLLPLQLPQRQRRYLYSFYTRIRFPIATTTVPTTTCVATAQTYLRTHGTLVPITACVRMVPCSGFAAFSVARTYRIALFTTGITPSRIFSNRPHRHCTRRARLLHLACLSSNGLHLLTLRHTQHLQQRIYILFENINAEHSS